MKIGPLQEAWLKTLEAGTHEQGKGQLCIEADEGYQFCCLGVACEVLIANGYGVDVDSVVHEEVTYWDYDGASHTMMKWNQLGLRKENGKLDTSKVSPEWKRELRFSVTTLAAINDRLRWDFPTIAQFIRENPEAVFTRSV